MNRQESLLKGIENVDLHKDVLLVCSDTMRGQKNINTLVSELNRDKKWVEAKFGDRLNSRDISDRFGCILAMYGTSGSAISSLRKKAESSNMVFHPLALTLNEARVVLQHLHERKHSTDSSEDQTNHVAQKQPKGFSGTFHDLMKNAVDINTANTVQLETDESTVDEKQDEELTVEAAAPEISVDDALAHIDSFRATVEAVGESIIVVGEAYKMLQQDNKILKHQLGLFEKDLNNTERSLHEKEKKISELITELIVAQEKEYKLLERNARLEEESQSYKNQLESIKQLLGLKA